MSNVIEPEVIETHDEDTISVEGFHRLSGGYPLVSLHLKDAPGDVAIAIMTPDEARILAFTLLRHAASLGWVEDDT